MNSDKAYMIANIINQAREHVETNFFTIGNALCIIYDEKLYKDYASHTVSMNEFLKEFGFSRSWAMNAMRVHRAFGKSDYHRIKHERLIKLLPLKLDDKEKEEWLEKARELPAQAFNDEIRQAKGLVPTDICEHKEYEVIKKCNACNRYIK